MNARYLDATEVAKIARKRLKAAFPGVTFSVKSHKYSGGSSVRVAYTDGPLSSEVEKVVCDLHGSDFDGMTDSRTYRAPAEIEGVGLARCGNDYIFVSRHVSETLRERVAQWLDRRLSFDSPIDREQWLYRAMRKAAIVGGHLVIVKA
jgi:hypothetical protein